QSLSVSVDRYELDTRKSLLDHAVDSVSSSAADSDDLHTRVLRRALFELEIHLAETPEGTLKGQSRTPIYKASLKASNSEIIWETKNLSLVQWIQGFPQLWESEHFYDVENSWPRRSLAARSSRVASVYRPSAM